MPESGATSGDFTSQPSSQQADEHSQPWARRYDAERGSDGRGVAVAPALTFAQNPPLNYLDFDTQSAHAEITNESGFGCYAPEADQDWDFTDFHFGSQDELAQVFYGQKVAPNDLNIQPPVNPLSPPRRPRPQGPIVQTSMKRKAESEPDSAVSQTASEQQNPAKRPAVSRASSTASLASPLVTEARSLPTAQTAAGQNIVDSAQPAAPQGNDDAQRRKDASKGTGPEGRVIDVSKPRRVVGSPDGMDMLPAGKVFPIQIGSALFRLSGASLSSDAPSYFSHFFSDQLHQNGGRAGDVRTLYIDRDPDTFRDIALHLQGYHIVPRDGEHYVKLFADAQFYSLPRLTKQLFKSDIFVRIGDTPFQIPRDTFSAPGDSPNYFSLGFAQFFSTPSEVFPGLDRSSLLRPPSIQAPSVPNKSGKIFGELMQILQGYDVEIRSDVHRAQLLRDARYFHLKGLEQRLIPCDISYNLKRQQSEILLRLEDIRQSGISFTPDQPPGSDASSASNTRSSTTPAGFPDSPAPSLSSSDPSHPRPGFVSYARPYTDDHSRTHILILETSTSESTTLYLPSTSTSTTPSSSSPLDLRATFHLTTLSRITSLFSVVAAKMGLPATQPLGLMYLQTGRGVAAQPVSPANSGVSETRVRVRLDAECALELDGDEAEVVCDARGRGVRSVKSARWVWGGSGSGSGSGGSGLSASDAEAHEVEWVVKRAHWRVRVEAVQIEGGESRMQVVLCPVRLQAFRAERGRNAARGFLGAA